MRALKREGDGATPRTRLVPIAAVTRRAAHLPLPTRRIRPCDAWCEDPGSQRYNRAISLPPGGRGDRLLRSDALYDVVLVTDHNQRPRVAGAGSAIFIHLARPNLTPTAGCIAFPSAVWARRAVPIAAYEVGDPRPVR